MALIEVFHVVATQLDIDATNTTDIPQGSIVTLNSAGQVTLCQGTDPLGIAADSRSRGTTSFTPESGSSLSTNPLTTLEGALVVGAYGAQQRYTQNRVADNYNEVLASGKMTVYHGGGEFWTDQYETLRDNGTTVITYTPADEVWASNGDNIANSNGGKFTDDSTSKAAQDLVGRVLNAPMQYPSGVPGVGEAGTGFTSLPEGGNSIAWGSFLHLKLVI